MKGSSDDHDEPQVSIDIWGICVSRDLFRVQDEFRGSEGRIRVNKYYKACSFMSQFSKRNGPSIGTDELSLLKSEKGAFATGIARKSALADYNKTLLKDLRGSGSEWLLIDGRADIYGVSRITYSDGSYDYLSNKTSHRYGISEILWQMGVEHKLEDIGTEYSEAEYRRSFNKLVKFVKDRYGDNVILNCSLDASFYLDFDGVLQESSSDRIAKNNAFLMRFNLDFIRATGCHYIKCPLFQTADVYHRWGLYTLHYIEEHYAYLERCIDAIVFGGDDIDRRLEELFMEYSALFAEIRAGETISLRNGIERFVAFKEEGSRDEAMALLERMIKQDFPQAKVEMAKLLAEGRFVDKDLRKALDLIQEAKDQGMGSADRDLFDILWREGDPGYYQQMVDLVLQKSEEGNKWAMQRMAKAYRYGIGVEKDLVEAAELMSKVSASNRSEEVRDIYFDLLLEVDDPARYEEMVGSVYRLAMDGSPDPEARYGLA